MRKHWHAINVIQRRNPDAEHARHDGPCPAALHEAAEVGGTLAAVDHNLKSLMSYIRLKNTRPGARHLLVANLDTGDTGRQKPPLDQD
jgi:hypothetical protein